MERKLVLDGRMLTYELERKQVKNINLRIRPDGSIYVSAPRRMPESMIEAFLESKAEFIFNAAERARKRRREIPAGKMLVLGCEVEDGFDSERKRDAWLKEQCVEAVSRAFARLYPIFERRGVPLPEIRFRRMKSRWGSCQPVRGVLTFNSALIHVPERCIEYVVLHELCHFIRPDHSPRFRAELDALMPDWRERQKEIRGYEGLLY